MRKIFALFLLLPLTSLAGVTLNDVHSQLNETEVREFSQPENLAELKSAVLKARKLKLPISISGGKHSMGGQQFGQGTYHINLSRFNRVVSLNEKKGIVEVESGIQWPELVDWLIQNQKGKAKPWGIRQKQTGADKLSIGGALSSNIHGRGLKMGPMIGDVESFTLIDAQGRVRNCSRKENPELFRLAIGGYGLFGVIGTVKVRLMKRTKLEREVVLATTEEIIGLVEKNTQSGFLYGDFQFSTDSGSEDFLRKGVFSSYRELADSEEVPNDGKELNPEQWKQLYYLAHAEKSQAYKMYTQYYLSTNGQRYWSDLHQMSVYIDDYHLDLDKKLNSKSKGTEMISEVYVPREKLREFMERARQDFLDHKVNLIYGTVRFIEKDKESFLSWAKDRYATIVFNFHVDHDNEGLEKVKADFVRLIDRALSFQGSYFLTYHRWARKDQLLQAYPQFPEFMRLKRRYDPKEVFQSEWYRHQKQLLGL